MPWSGDMHIWKQNQEAGMSRTDWEVERVVEVEVRDTVEARSQEDWKT